MDLSNKYSCSLHKNHLFPLYISKKKYCRITFSTVVQQASNGLEARMTKRFTPIKEYFVSNYGISKKIKT